MFGSFAEFASRLAHSLFDFPRVHMINLKHGTIVCKINVESIFRKTNVNIAHRPLLDLL